MNRDDSKDLWVLDGQAYSAYHGVADEFRYVPYAQFVALENIAKAAREVVRAVDAAWESGGCIAPDNSDLVELRAALSSPSAPPELVPTRNEEAARDFLASHFDEWLRSICAEVPGHPAAEDCPVPECPVCAVRDCPHGAPEHYWRDGCPACWELQRSDELPTTGGI